MSDTIIKVENLSKRYRLGQYEKEDTFAGQLKNTLLYPIRNFRRIASLSKFGEDENDPSIFWALQDVNFEVKQGEVLGIIGKNGAGKSTLLKLLSKITEPTTGRIVMKGRVSALLEVGTGFHPELTGRDNVYMNGTILGMTRREIDAKFEEIVEFAGVAKHIDTPVKFYSSGMTVRLGFSVAAHLEPEVLIIDEVLAVGDFEFQKKCLGKMDDVAQSGRTVLFVSHNMGSVAELCGKSLLLEKGKVLLIDDAKTVIQKYLSKQGSNTKKYPNTSPIRFLEIYQLENVIVLTAHYNLNQKYKFLNFGFVFYDHIGNPIFGSNPQIHRIIMPNDIKLCGKINAYINEPKLLDGSYSVSVWLGDGSENFFHDTNCLSIDIQGMTNILQLNKSVVGHVVPKVKFVYE